ncbi:MAG: succinate dehydrogenase, cytochrome b556 subunit [Gammaproteobacteria bacterium]|nr:succinate dehydrogenase, cytochrome b556 subunit [Gammaproteobacteria bacterium]
MNKQRPVNLDLTTINLPLMALTSITHRVTGILLFLSLPLMLWALDLSLSSQASFDALKAMLAQPFTKLVTLGILAALVYHLVAGIRHLIMDLGYGETKEGGVTGSRIVIAVALVLIAVVGVYTW